MRVDFAPHVGAKSRCKQNDSKRNNAGKRKKDKYGAA
jgi:hypothetical protein